MSRAGPLIGLVTALHVSLAGSNGSQLAKYTPLLFPPATSTSPLRSKVAV